MEPFDLRSIITEEFQNEIKTRSAMLQVLALYLQTPRDFRLARAVISAVFVIGSMHAKTELNFAHDRIKMRSALL